MGRSLLSFWPFSAFLASAFFASSLLLLPLLSWPPLPSWLPLPSLLLLLPSWIPPLSLLPLPSWPPLLSWPLLPSSWPPLLSWPPLPSWPLLHVSFGLFFFDFQFVKFLFFSTITPRHHSASLSFDTVWSRIAWKFWISPLSSWVMDFGLVRCWG